VSVNGTCRKSASARLGTFDFRAFAARLAEYMSFAMPLVASPPDILIAFEAEWSLLKAVLRLGFSPVGCALAFLACAEACGE
jgi:hypothetical protein